MQRTKDHPCPIATYAMHPIPKAQKKKLKRSKLILRPRGLEYTHGTITAWLPEQYLHNEIPVDRPVWSID